MKLPSSTGTTTSGIEIPMPLHQKLGQRSLQVNEQKVHELHLSTVAIVEHTLHSRENLSTTYAGTQNYHVLQP